MKSADYANAAHRGEAKANPEKETLPPVPVRSAGQEETTRRGLRILARVVMREYLRRLGVWPSADPSSRPISLDPSGGAAPDPPPVTGPLTDNCRLR